MKRINIFKPGTHTSASGSTLSFSETDLQATVDAYDPELHEAPITVGHPKDNLPAYGWIKGLSFSEERGLDATPDQVDADFAEMVTAGRFKKVSASFYSPDAPNNPKPGVFYLRHVGFLGAQPPAIKGLKSVEFNEAEEGVVEFSEPWDTQNTASIFRRLREFIIEKFSKDEADQVIPDYAISDLEDSARRQIIKPEVAPAPANFNEPNEVTDMDQAQLDAEKAKLKEQEDALKAKEASFSEREQRIAEAEAKAHRSAVEAKVDALVKAGKVLPAERERITNFACSLNAEHVVEFSEGDEKKTAPGEELLFNFLEGLKPRIDTKERSAGDEHTAPENPAALAKLAVNYREEQAAKGIVVTASEAVAHVQKQHAAV